MIGKPFTVVGEPQDEQISTLRHHGKILRFRHRHSWVDREAVKQCFHTTGKMICLPVCTVS